MKKKEKAPSLRFKDTHGKDYPAWEQRKLGDIAKYKKGPFGSSLRKEDFVPKDVNTAKVYEQRNVIQKNWKLERYFITLGKLRSLRGFETGPGDILISCAGTIGELYELPKDAPRGLLNQALMRVRVDEKIILKGFFKYIFLNAVDKLTATKSNGSAIKNIPPFSDIKGTEILLPSLKEQQKLSLFLGTVDEIITLHQRKLEALKKLKRTLLQKMFPKKGQLKPELRFPEFTNDWEQRKLSAYARKIKRASSESSAPILMITADKGFIEQAQRYSFDNAGKSLKKYTLLNKGELAYNHGASKLRPDGSCFSLEEHESARVPYVYHCFSVPGQNASFFSYLLNTTSIQKELRKLVSSGARQDGLLNITFEQYCSVPIKVPTKEEQQRIAIFFQKLEYAITLHQRKLETYKKLKKGLLQKMFI